MKAKGLPKLNLGEGDKKDEKPPETPTGEEPQEGEKGTEPRDSKLFNIRISEGCKERLRLLKEDPLMESITWNDLLEMLVMLLCQNGCVGEEGIKKIEKSGGWKGGIPREMKRELGIGTRWPEIGPAVTQLSEEVKHAWGVLSQVEDALYEFATAIEASEEAEATPPPEAEAEEEGLFKTGGTPQ